MKIALAVLALLIAVFIASRFLSPPADNGTGPTVEGLPWQIEVLSDGQSKVAGLTLGTSTVADVQRRFGDDMELAVVAAPGETGAVEAYWSDVTLGAVTGRLIVTADLTPETVEGMRQRSKKAEYMKSSTKQWRLSEDDVALTQAAPIRALTFIPAANLDEAIVLQRFGKPAERVRTSEHVEHFLYPERGLDLALDTEGKELLQYVAPRRFAELRTPLVNKPETPAGSSK